MERRVDEDMVVRTLNCLLASLQIPLVLQSHNELTPSLILNIFESMFRTHLPISPETRKSATYRARVEAMKIFIGVLEDDVLGIDVGLGEIDPRRLAEGKREEVLRVADILCWLGRRMNYVSQDGLSVGHVAPSRNVTDGDARPTSPSMLSAMSTSQNSSLLMHSAHFDESQTSMSTHDSFDDESESLHGEGSFSFLAQSSPPPRRARSGLMQAVHRYESDVDLDLSPPSRPLRRASRRHDFDSEEDSDIDDSYCHCRSEVSDESSVAPALRTSGCLERVDFEDELRRYSSRRSKFRDDAIPRARPSKASLCPSSSRSPSFDTSPSTVIITRHTSPIQYTLALLDERAKLLADLARLRQDRT